jgi:hypothetical protein
MLCDRFAGRLAVGDLLFAICDLYLRDVGDYDLGYFAE